MRYITALLLLFAASTSFAFPPSYTDGDQMRIYHQVLNSTLINPDIAQAVGLERANNIANITVSLSSKNQDGTFSLGQDGLLKAYIMDGIGKRIDIKFKPIVEPGSTYYIGQFRYTNHERIRVFINAGFDDGRRANANFNQVMWVEKP